jgi:hypothetical protein
MATPDARRAVQRARARIECIRSALAHYELMCSGTLSERMMKCGKPNCGCAKDPAARHGPYYEWGRMRAGKQTHRYVNATQAQILRRAIANYRGPRRLLLEWEEHTERLIDAAEPKPPKT